MVTDIDEVTEVVAGKVTNETHSDKNKPAGPQARDTKKENNVETSLRMCKF